MNYKNFSGMLLLAATLSLGACKDADERNDDAADTMTESMENNSSMPNTNPMGDSANAMGTDSSAMNMDTSRSSTMATSSTSTTTRNNNNRKSKKGKSVRYVVKLNNTPKGSMTADKSGVYSYAEVMPSFTGGEQALERFIQDNLEYPQEALDNDVEGQVMVSFAVDENGRVYEPSVVGRKLGYGLEQAALDVVRKMPNWSPGRIKGQNVKTRFTLPITYQLY